MLPRERAKSGGEGFEPRLVHLRQREREQRPGRLRAHRRHVAEIHSKRAVTNRRWRRIRQEMYAGHERVRLRDELHIGGEIE